MQEKIKSSGILKLRRWLSVPGNTKTLIASALNYDSSTTINNWLSRNRIPKRELLNVLKIIEGKK